ncbi:MAG: glucosidase, partial [Planctomycetota bacterium]
MREEVQRQKNWKRWGPYLSERQWGTVREDYSADGDCWNYFPHDHARSRAYRWGEDGLLGITDRRCRLCFGLALWNGQDNILKERLFGVTNGQGNHGEDVKECYYYLDATPTGSYLKSLYKYPQTKFPYDHLIEANAHRSRDEMEFELEDTGIFDESRYFDVVAEYAKASPNDIAIRITVTNRGPDAAACHVLPQLWFRNGWSWGARHDGTFDKPLLQRVGKANVVQAHHTARRYALGDFVWHAEDAEQLLFTENETNTHRLYDDEGPQLAKDGFHEYIIEGEEEAVSDDGCGTKAAAVYRLQLEPGQSKTIRLRLHAENEAPADPFGDFDDVFQARIAEAEAFYDHISPPCIEDDEKPVWRQSYAGLLHTKQFYHYVVDQWKDGDPAMPPPPPARDDTIRNDDWDHLFNYDIISMPDKWEYPWYAAWDLAFHMLPMARVDPKFAKAQLKLLMREWYMRPDGALPAYEFAFSDVNPPVHAWAVWRVYKMTGPRGERDLDFLAS